MRRILAWIYWETFRFVLSTFIAVMLAGFVAGLADSLLSPDPSARVPTGFVVSALLWLYALFTAQALAHSPDESLFAFTPLTARRYFIRNARLSWAQHLMAYAGLPFVAALMWRYLASDAMRRTLDWEYLTLLSAFAGYYAILLGALAQAVSGPSLPTNGLFVTRHLFRRFKKKSITLFVCAGGVNWLTDGAVLDLLHRAADSLLGLGDLGFVILALVSPVSAVVAQELPALSEQAVIIVAGLWLITIGSAGFAIRNALIRPMPHWEREVYDAWLDARRDVQEEEELAAEEEEAEMQAWAARSLWKHADDVADADPAGKALPYDAALAPEDQLLRDIRFSESHEEVRSMSLPGRIADRAFHYPWASVVLLLWLSWPWTIATDRYELWPGKIALCLAILVAFFGNAWWTNALSSALALPVRLARLFPKTFRGGWLSYTLPCDALAVALWASSLRVGVLPALSILLVVQLMRVTGVLHTWNEVIYTTGSYRFLNLVDLLMAAFTVCLAFPLVMILPTNDNPRIFEELPTHLAAYLGAGSLIAVYALLLLCAHRRADSSLPQNLTSYAHGDLD